MRILVTGGAGFIGSQVVEAYMAAGHEVGSFDDLSTGRQENVPRGSCFWVGDIRSPQLMEAIRTFRPDLVNHHAAQVSVQNSIADPRLDAEINILGTLNLLEGCRVHGIRQVIFASTGGAIYGEQEAVPTSEDSPQAPSSPYGAAKLAAERYVFVYAQVHGIRSVALRYANVYGPRQDPHGEAGVVAIFCERLLRGRELVVNGDGEQTRDYLYVGDAVQANLLAAANPPADPFVIVNIGTGKETTVNALRERLVSVSGRQPVWRHGPARPGEQRRSAVDPSRARRLFGWHPSTSLEAGLLRTWNWFASR